MNSLCIKGFCFKHSGSLSKFLFANPIIKIFLLSLLPIISSLNALSVVFLSSILVLSLGSPSISSKIRTAGFFVFYLQ